MSHLYCITSPAAKSLRSLPAPSLTSPSAVVPEISRGNAARDTGDEGGHAYLPQDVDEEPTYQSINRGRLENIKDAQLKEQQERRRLEEKIDKLTMMMEAQHGHRVQGDRDSTIRKKIPQSGLRENDGAGYPTNKGSFVDDETARKDLYFIMAMPVHSMRAFPVPPICSLVPHVGVSIFHVSPSSLNLMSSRRSTQTITFGSLLIVVNF